MANDLGVKLQATSIERGINSEHEDSSRRVISDIYNLNQYLDEINIGSPSHGDNTDLDEEDPKKRLQWWHNTIGNVWMGKMIEGKSSRGKRKWKTIMTNFSLMMNAQEIYEPYVFEGEMVRFEWEKGIEIEHASLMINHTCDLTTIPLGKKPIGCKGVQSQVQGICHTWKVQGTIGCKRFL